jgi:membrane-anchored protein YejM (alkaline phosphatase superfamily)
MVSKMDESVGLVVEALQKKRMLNNSIIVFIADNGAPSVDIFQNWGSNYPLRGVSVPFSAVFHLSDIMLHTFTHFSTCCYQQSVARLKLMHLRGRFSCLDLSH